jgi:acyl-CoA thioesterase-1
MKFSLVRRYCIALLFGLGITGACIGQSPQPSTSTQPSKSPPVILVVGDSLSAEYGLQRGTGWVALLEQRLIQEKNAAKVVNASISGDTTSGGRDRLPALLSRHQPTLVVIELGGNDALRGLPLTMTQDNLQAMTRMAQKSGAKVLLAGMQLPPNYGQRYGQDFVNTFAKVAKDNKAALVPFLLKGVADGANPTALFQADRIHPTEAAHPIILDTMWPPIKKLIQ